MFETDSLGGCFVLEFKFPKDISDNQEHVELPVHRVNAPLYTLCLNSMPIKLFGEIHCFAYYKFVKDIVPMINKWINSIQCTCDNLHNISNNLLVEAKLYYYKNDQSLFKKWKLIEFHPLLNPNNEYTDGNIELVFKFENVIEEANKSMYNISKYIKEYKDRENKCEYCAYHNMIGGRCNQCEDHNWFVQEINLKQYIIKRVTEDSAEEFANSKEGRSLKEKVDLRKNVYDDFNKYVEKQKEFLDNELELKYKELSELSSDYVLEMGKYSCSNIDKALASLDSMQE